MTRRALIAGIPIAIPVAVAVAVAGYGCGSTATTARTDSPTTTTVAAPPAPKRIVLTITSASIDGTKPDGTTWDNLGKAPGAWAEQASGPLASYLAQHPELDGTEKTVGQPVEMPDVPEAASNTPGPDPMVFVEVSGQVFRTPVRTGQFQPVWQFPLVIELAPDALVRITVVDWDSPATNDVIGETTVAASQLLGARTHEVPRFGNVERLSLAISDPPPPARHRVSVASRPTWTDSGITVIAGQEISFVATGVVCTRGGDQSRCAGPEGQATTSDANVRGFELRGHGLLVGAVGDVRFSIGRERRFVAPSSGGLLLGVNDVDTSNNKGELEVSVSLK